MINPIHIQTFLTLLKTKHFTQTATLLNMTQPGVSQHLKSLETELNVSLFHRHGKKIDVTLEGERFYQFAIERMAAEKQLRESLCTDSPHKGECRITCSGSMAIQLYPKLLDLQKQYSELKFCIESAPNAVAIDLVKKGTFDIGLITCFTNDPDLQVKELGYEELCLTVPKGYSCAWDDLMALGYINHPNGKHYATQVFEQNYRKNFKGFAKIPQASYVNQINQILLPVSQGIGFTVLPESTVGLFPDQGCISKVQLQTPCKETIYLITKKYRSLPNRYQLISTLLNNHW